MLLSESRICPDLSDFADDCLWYRQVIAGMPECFSVSMFDVFPGDALLVAEPLKIRVIRAIRVIRDSDTPLHNHNLTVS